MHKCRYTQMEIRRYVQMQIYTNGDIHKWREVFMNKCRYSQMEISRYVQMQIYTNGDKQICTNVDIH